MGWKFAAVPPARAGLGGRRDVRVSFSFAISITAPPEAAAIRELAYEGVDTIHTDLAIVEQQAAELQELAELFDFADQMKKTNDYVGRCRGDLLLIKATWDLATVVQTTLDEWNTTLWAATSWVAPAGAEMSSEYNANCAAANCASNFGGVPETPRRAA
mgnify:CR=1 FL=1